MLFETKKKRLVTFSHKKLSIKKDWKRKERDKNIIDQKIAGGHKHTIKLSQLLKWIYRIFFITFICVYDLIPENQMTQKTKQKQSNKYERIK